MNYPRPATCASCNREPNWLGDIQQLLGKYFSVTCVCGHSGPVANTRQNAAIRWNEQQSSIVQQQIDKENSQPEVTS
jgi:hypothetical protein